MPPIATSAERVATPNDLLIDSGGEHVYVLGERELEVYRRDGAVRFQPGSAVEPEVCPQHGDGTGDGHIYVAADDTLVTLAQGRRDGRGRVRVRTGPRGAGPTTPTRRKWDDASVVLSGTGEHVFFVGSESPLVAVFGIGESLDYDPAEPTVVGVVEAYYFDSDRFTYGPTLFSHVASPWSAQGCTAIAAHDDSTAARRRLRRPVLHGALGRRGRGCLRVRLVRVPIRRTGSEVRCPGRRLQRRDSWRRVVPEASTTSW